MRRLEYPAPLSLGSSGSRVAGSARRSLFSARNSVAKRAAVLLVAALVSAQVTGCGSSGPARAPVAQEWLGRAQASYRAGDFEDAAAAVESSLKNAPNDPEVRVLAARIALTRLEFAQAIKWTVGIATSEAHAIRGRAFWYMGDLEPAADALEAMLADPKVKDPWARDISKLARRGQGRRPFAMEGGLVAAVDMPRVGPALIVPCELNGERILALVATAMGEVVVDSATRKEPAWVNLRFGERLEVNDVPALTQDLSGVSRQLGAPVKALLGMNLLRHTNVTFDRRGDQFVVRKNEPAAPPEASRVPLWYARGGGMMMRAKLAARDDAQAILLVDSSSLFSMALEDDAWRMAGVDVQKLTAEPGEKVKTGTIPQLRLGGFDLPSIPAVAGAPMNDVRQALDIGIGGIVGAGLLSVFRVTFGDEGRFVWLEPDPMMTSAPPSARRKSSTEDDPRSEPGDPAPGVAGEKTNGAAARTTPKGATQGAPKSSGKSPATGGAR